MSRSFRAQESISTDDNDDDEKFLDAFHIGDVILPSFSDDLRRPRENRQERNFAEDDCGGCHGVRGRNDGERRATVFDCDAYGFERMKRRQDAAFTIQHFWRVKMEEKIGGFAATVVQAQWRKHAASKRYGTFLRAAVSLQSLARSKRARKSLRRKIAERDEIRNRASTRIQSIARGYVARSKYDLEEIVHRVILCQSVARRFIAIGTLCRLYCLHCLLQDISARKIQRAYRNYKNGSTLTRRLMNQRRVNYGDYGDTVVEDSLVFIVVDDDEMDFESKCCEHSRCGLSDEVHAMLIESGRWFYDKLGDPDVDAAENLITVMEVSEEASFCCWGRSTVASRRTRGPAKAVSKKTNKMGTSSVLLIQSK
ncbi:hypothetical protein ACHAW6_004339 [Cyclotella cf. meneghiniana]